MRAMIVTIKTQIDILFFTEPLAQKICIVAAASWGRRQE